MREALSLGHEDKLKHSLLRCGLGSQLRKFSFQLRNLEFKQKKVACLKKKDPTIFNSYTYSLSYRKYLINI